MSHHRFFLSRDALVHNDVRFREDQSRQIKRVLRLSAGDHVVALDGEGTEYDVQLIEAGRVARGRVLGSRCVDTEPKLKITLYQALLKAAKLEWVLQKATELGVTHFVLVKTERTVAGDPSRSRCGRFEDIVREAAEQCGRGILPSIGPVVPFEAALERAHNEGASVLLWEEEKERRLRQSSIALDANVCLFIGPEGGFPKGEVDAAASSGVEIASLGPRVLRAETAALVGVSLLLHRSGDLG